MELLFLAILILTMVGALASGFPVAFALPGSAIVTILLAAICGLAFEGEMGAYFAQGDPIQWLNAGVTNFRGIYWEPERDTLIAIPLFVFMGIMLERSKIAEDLLITMAQLFGPVPGGLGISVVFVGALLAATTGIVGATVIAMGLISLPVMLRNNYSKSLATGTIAASGTLGQIIPPSIVLIILADQLSSATDQALNIRQADYRAVTGSSSLPAEYGLTSTSAGDMFLGAFLPGMVLVGVYMAYILIAALIRPKIAPAVPFKGKYDKVFAGRVLLVLVPPLALIVAVLGSIILGIATVNQAGAIGAVGAMIMAGYRLKAGERGAYIPAIMAVLSIAAIIILLSLFEINVKNIADSEDALAVTLAAIAVTVLLISIAWSAWRAFKIENTLTYVMVETAKTSSLVFIILLGAAMLTASFRAFGGEELVRDFLTGLPGGFMGKFIVVMAVIFLLGFFLDFIEIAVVVVPIIAPILLADPSANVTAVWLGVMIGVNIQTSFLTPPFGFALFYLRGVAPPEVTTLQMYKGVVPFILLQLLGLFIVGAYPSLVNYLPNRVYLTSETAPPPQNPRLQLCLEEQLFESYDERSADLQSSMDMIATLDLSSLPDEYRQGIETGIEKARATFEHVEAVRAAEVALDAYVEEYRPLHADARDVQREIFRINEDIVELDRRSRRLSGSAESSEEEIEEIQAKIAELEARKGEIDAQIPEGWEASREGYLELADVLNKARVAYRRNVDAAYEPVATVRGLLAGAETLGSLREHIEGLVTVVANAPFDEAVEAAEDVLAMVRAVEGTSSIASKVSKTRRALRGQNPDRAEAAVQLAEALVLYDAEVAWRQQAVEQVAPGLNTYNEAIHDTIGARLQERLTKDQATTLAVCLSHHRDVSLNF
jgi:tripartite ATP-independent transporter DctM subunit